MTVEKKTGAMLHHHHGQQTHLGLPRRFRRAHENGQAVPDKYSDVTIVDLPGIYSLSPYSMEEIVSRNFIVQEKPDVVINIVDATNLERNLYLTLQLLQLGRPVVVALNMMDEVRSHGDVIDLAAMEKGLGVPVVAICARKGEGLDELVRPRDGRGGEPPSPAEAGYLHRGGAQGAARDPASGGAAGAGARHDLALRGDQAL